MSKQRLGGYAVAREVPHHELLKGFEVNYADAFSVVLPPGSEITAEDIAQSLFSDVPCWVRRLVALRDLLVWPMGLKTSRDFERNAESTDIGLMKVKGRTADALLVGEDDHHLGFRVLSQVVQREDGAREAIVATFVHFNHWFGHVYFLFIKPFHRRIVSDMLGKTAGKLAPAGRG